MVESVKKPIAKIKSDLTVFILLMDRLRDQETLHSYSEPSETLN